MRSLITLLFTTLVLAGCAAPGQTSQDKRAHIHTTERQVLNELYGLKPALRAQLQAAPGYAVFSNVNVKLFLASGGTGYGSVVDNRTGRRTYMKMAEVGVGLGLGIKDFRAVFVFDDAKVMERFVKYGWTFGGHVDAAAKAQDKGAAFGEEVVIDGMRVFQLTESGLALQASLKGTKYWQDYELN